MAKVVVRRAEPSAGGHGVSPVTDAPAGGIVTDTGVGAALELALSLAGVEAGLLSPPLRHARNTIAPTMTTTMIPKFRTLRNRWRRFCSAMAAATRT